MQSKDGKTPLHMTAIHGRFSRSQAVIKNGKHYQLFIPLHQPFLLLIQTFRALHNLGELQLSIRLTPFL